MAKSNRNIGLLIEQAKAGGEDAEKAFSALTQEYQKSVYYLIFKMVKVPEDAQDLTQDTFVKAFSSIQKFNPQFAFSTWIFKIATNNCIDFIRRQKMITVSINETGQNEDNTNNFLQIEDQGLIPSDAVIREQRKHYLMKAINSLPDRYQQLVRLRYFDELSYEEVAEKMQLPLGTVKAQLHRSRELLNDALKKMEFNI